MRQREPRRKVMILARIRFAERWSDVCIRNVSSQGMMIEGRQVPRRGTYVEIRRQRVVIVGRVIWSDAERCGVRTRERIDPARLIDGGSPSSPDNEVDRSSRSRSRAGAADFQRSRHASAIAQFAATVICAGALATVVLHPVYEMVSRTMSGVSVQLDK